MKHPLSILTIKALSNGHTILNVLPFYDAIIGYEHVQSYSLEAIEIYNRILVFDLIILIPVYVSFFSLGLLYFGNKLLKNRRKLVSFVASLPIFAGFLNIIEDGAVFYLLQSFPVRFEHLMAITGMITTTKSLIITISLILIFTALLISLAKKMFSPGPKPGFGKMLRS